MKIYHTKAAVRALTFVVFIAINLIGQLTHAASVTATVDRNNITIEETLNLKIRLLDDNQSSSPDLTDLEINFEILSQSRSNQYRSFNGQVESWVEWSMVLAPKKVGTLLIPSFNVAGEFTTPIEINVEKPKPLNLSGGQLRDIFIETEVDFEKPFVQQQVLLTVRLNTSLPISTLNRQDLILPNAKVEVVNEQRFTRNIKNREFAVVELTFAIYPQESGLLSIPSMTWQATIGTRPTSLFNFRSGRSNQRRLTTEELTLQVQPKPSSYSGDTWLPASSLAITEAWGQDFSSFKQGEPISRRVIVTAQGLTGSQLPELEINYPTNINSYPEATKVEEQKNERGITTNAIQTQALLVTQPGHYTLPELSLTWFNVNTGQEEQVNLPEREIFVQASASAVAPPPPPVITSEPSLTGTTTNTADGQSPSQPVNSSNWTLLLLTNIITALVVALLLFWWIKSKGHTAKRNNVENNYSTQASKNLSVKQLTKELKNHCANKDDKNIRTTLLKVCAVQKPHEASNLDLLAESLSDPVAQLAIKNLDKKLFDANALVEINYSAIINGVESLATQAKPQHSSPLPPLNPAISNS